MLKLLFKRIRVLLLVALVVVVLVLFITGKSLQLKSNVVHNIKAHQDAAKDNLIKSDGAFLAFLKESRQHKISNGAHNFRSALERPKSYKPVGLGEFGVKVVLQNLTKEEKNEEDSLRREYGINHFLSQKISLHRTLKDPRPPQCTRIADFDYAKFPLTSIVIVFYNEGWSTLMRTIYSVLHNTHDNLLVEVILIDDFSDMPHLKQPLNDLLEHLPKTRLIRNIRREGIVRSRLLGLSEAKGEVVAYVDCHCECTRGWLEPLLVSIMEDNSTLAVPVTDDVDSETFQYYYGSYEPSIGGFTWDLFFHWRPMSAEQRSHQKNHAQPIRTPTISGGLFAVNKQFFLHIGSYDPGMDVWGGENVEVSFRTWMCGGRILIHPCSHIGHVSRNKNTYSRESVWKNVGRAAAVWWDEKYMQLFRNRLAKRLRDQDYGDVSERKKLVKNLHCRNFDWYLKNVFPEKYVPENTEGAFGTVYNVAQPRLCLDLSGDKLTVYGCHGYINQQFELNSLHVLRQNEEECIVPDLDKITITKCPLKGQEIPPKLMWKHTSKGWLQHTESKHCMEIFKAHKTSPDNTLAMRPCDPSNSLQQWKFRKIE